MVGSGGSRLQSTSWRRFALWCGWSKPCFWCPFSSSKPRSTKRRQRSRWDPENNGRSPVGVQRVGRCWAMPKGIRGCHSGSNVSRQVYSRGTTRVEQMQGAVRQDGNQSSASRRWRTPERVNNLGIHCTAKPCRTGEVKESSGPRCPLHPVARIFKARGRLSSAGPGSSGTLRRGVWRGPVKRGVVRPRVRGYAGPPVPMLIRISRRDAETRRREVRMTSDMDGPGCRGSCCRDIRGDVPVPVSESGTGGGFRMFWK